MNPIENLALAKQKLQEAGVPFQLCITSYLRVCYFMFDRDEDRYSKLLKALYRYDANWWQTCHISAYGGLQSTDPVITALLHSIESSYDDNLQPQELNLHLIAA